MDDPPQVITIVPDDGHAQHVGRTGAGHPFFLTYPFVPRADGRTQAYIALYLFDDVGTLVSAQIHRTSPNNINEVELELLVGIAPVEHVPIVVAPFSVSHDGHEFGLIPRALGGEWNVTAEPGDYMAFFSPWDSGIYDT